MELLINQIGTLFRKLNKGEQIISFQNTCKMYTSINFSQITIYSYNYFSKIWFNYVFSV